MIKNVLLVIFMLFLIAGSAIAQERAIAGTGYIPGMVIKLEKEKQYWFTTRWYPEQSTVVEIRKNGDVVFSDGYMIPGGVPLLALPKNVTLLNGQKELVQFWKNFNEKKLKVGDRTYFVYTDDSGMHTFNTMVTVNKIYDNKYEISAEISSDRYAANVRIVTSICIPGLLWSVEKTNNNKWWYRERLISIDFPKAAAATQ